MLKEIKKLQVPNNIEELIDVTKITVDTLKNYPGIIDQALCFIIPFSEKFDIRYNSIFYIEQIMLKNHYVKNTIAYHPSWRWVKRYRHYVLDDEYLEYKETIKNTFETLKKVCTKEYNYDII